MKPRQSVEPLTPLFGARVSGIDLSETIRGDVLLEIRRLIEEYAVICFPDQTLSTEKQIEFSNLFGPVQKSISVARPEETRRFDRQDVSDISNVGNDGRALNPQHVRRRLQLANQLWHTDNSFRDPSGGYTFLFARQVPDAGGETEFADARAAFDRVPEERRRQFETLEAFHSLARSRSLVGGPPLSAEEALRFPGRVQPLVVTTSGGRRALYAGSHASHVVDLDEREGRALLDEVDDAITDPRHTYAHQWSIGDLVMWDNRATLHRGRPFDERRQLRDLRRTTVANVTVAPVLAEDL